MATRGCSWKAGRTRVLENRPAARWFASPAILTGRPARLQTVLRSRVFHPLRLPSLLRAASRDDLVKHYALTGAGPCPRRTVPKGLPGVCATAPAMRTDGILMPRVRIPLPQFRRRTSGAERRSNPRSREAATITGLRGLLLPFGPAAGSASCCPSTAHQPERSARELQASGTFRLAPRQHCRYASGRGSRYRQGGTVVATAAGES